MCKMGGPTVNKKHYKLTFFLSVELAPPSIPPRLNSLNNTLWKPLPPVDLNISLEKDFMKSWSDLAGDRPTRETEHMEENRTEDRDESTPVGQASQPSLSDTQVDTCCGRNVVDIVAEHTNEKEEETDESATAPGTPSGDSGKTDLGDIVKLDLAEEKMEGVVQLEVQTVATGAESVVSRVEDKITASTDVQALAALPAATLRKDHADTALERVKDHKDVDVAQITDTAHDGLTPKLLDSSSDMTDQNTVAVKDTSTSVAVREYSFSTASDFKPPPLPKDGLEPLVGLAVEEKATKDVSLHETNLDHEQPPVDVALPPLPTRGSNETNLGHEEPPVDVALPPLPTKDSNNQVHSPVVLPKISTKAQSIRSRKSSKFIIKSNSTNCLSTVIYPTPVVAPPNALAHAVLDSHHNSTIRKTKSVDDLTWKKRLASIFAKERDPILEAIDENSGDETNTTDYDTIGRSRSIRHCKSTPTITHHRLSSTVSLPVQKSRSYSFSSLTEDGPYTDELSHRPSITMQSHPKRSLSTRWSKTYSPASPQRGVPAGCVISLPGVYYRSVDERRGRSRVRKDLDSLRSSEREGVRVSGR